MSQDPIPNNTVSILGTFASVVGLLGISLYYTGWIYRWAYYRVFHIEISTLNLPLQSFLFVPIQVLVGNFWAVSKSLFALFLAIIFILLTLWLFQILNSDLCIRNFVQFTFLKNYSFKPLCLLIQEIVIVIWILFFLFWLARWQGITDAKRDAINRTSTLPVVTLIIPEEKSALGRRVDDLTLNPPLSKYHIFGDKLIFDSLIAKETNDTRNSNNLRVWRLLLEKDGWIYIFSSLDKTKDPFKDLIVIAMPKSSAGDQLMILSPGYTRIR